MRIAERPADRNRRGVAAIELAVALPLLVLLLLGCVDVGRLTLRYICLSNAASEAATFASLNAPGQFGGVSGWIAAVRQRAISESALLSPPLTVAEILVDTSVLGDGLVSVQVESSFETIVSWPGLPQTWMMVRKVVLSQTA
ncbi:MAG: TadE/TadG family type IV pilus assembly protein [Planctomycetota bacterium]